jgi:Ran GTPase-activating protein (RanGAP) involved in mRNA processing and transport
MRDWYEEQLRQCHSVRLGGRGLTDADAAAWARQHVPCLTLGDVDLSDNLLTAQGACSMLAVMTDPKVLRLDGNRLRGTPVLLRRLCDCILRCRLQELHLSRNALSPRAVEELRRAAAARASAVPLILHVHPMLDAEPMRVTHTAANYACVFS